MEGLDLEKTEGGTPRWRRLPDERREAILTAALAEFEHNGLDGARMDDIAVGAGLSKGSIYRYFPDKMTLFADSIAAAVAGSVARHLPIGSRDPEAHLKRLWDVANDARFRTAYRLSLTQTSGLNATKEMVRAQIENVLIKPFAVLLGQRERETIFSAEDALKRARLAVATLLGVSLSVENTAESVSAGVAFLLRACELEKPSPQADGF